MRKRRPPQYLEEGNVVRPIVGWFAPREEVPDDGLLHDVPSILKFMIETVSLHHASRARLEECQQTFEADGRLDYEQSTWLRGWYQARMRVIEAKDRDRRIRVDAREKLAAERAAFKAEKEAERAALKQLKAELAAERAALKLELAEIKREHAALDRAKAKPTAGKTSRSKLSTERDSPA